MYWGRCLLPLKPRPLFRSSVLSSKINLRWVRKSALVLLAVRDEEDFLSGLGSFRAPRQPAAPEKCLVLLLRRVFRQLQETSGPCFLWGLLSFSLWISILFFSLFHVLGSANPPSPTPATKYVVLKQHCSEISKPRPAVNTFFPNGKTWIHYTGKLEKHTRF